MFSFYLSQSERHIFKTFLHRNINGSVIAEFDVHFTTTGNSTALQIADDILKNSLNRSKNATNFGVMQADPSHAFLVGKKVTIK